jgi:hypothetical protein
MTLLNGMTLREAAAVLRLSTTYACDQRKRALRAMRGAVA